MAEDTLARETWQPIETAPKNVLVLVFDPVGVVPEFSSIFSDWPVGMKVHVLPAFLKENAHGEYGWETIVAEYDLGVSSDPGFSAWSVCISPTHWMPMPEAPSVKRGRII